MSSRVRVRNHVVNSALNSSIRDDVQLFLACIAMHHNGKRGGMNRGLRQQRSSQRCYTLLCFGNCSFRILEAALVTRAHASSPPLVVGMLMNIHARV